MSKVVTGSRAKIFIDNVLVGLFESCTIANSNGVEAIHILGRYSPSELAITSKEAVNVSCSGFRVVGQGKHLLPKVPKIQDLLNFEPFTMTVVDRQTGETIETILGCVPNSDNSSYSAKATSRISVSYTGVRAGDESGPQDESAGAADLP